MPFSHTSRLLAADTGHSPELAPENGQLLSSAGGPAGAAAVEEAERVGAALPSASGAPARLRQRQARGRRAARADIFLSTGTELGIFWDLCDERGSNASTFPARGRMMMICKRWGHLPVRPPTVHVLSCSETHLEWLLFGKSHGTNLSQLCTKSPKTRIPWEIRSNFFRSSICHPPKRIAQTCNSLSSSKAAWALHYFETELFGSHTTVHTAGVRNCRIQSV